MLELDTRTAILEMRSRGVGVRAIARVLRVSRNAVRAVLESGRREVEPLERDELLGAHVDTVRALSVECKGNLVRVGEILAGLGIRVGYSTLTAFCRRHEIGTTPKVAAGRYHFEPGEEMQHDTSPHVVTIGGRSIRVQCASLVMCFSRAIYAQVHWRFTRFECRSFLSEACTYFGGSAGRCVVDNTSVVIGHGTGRDAVAAPEMLALAERFGFSFLAHEVGDANRSARVERPFHYIENNFYVGRTFSSLADLNAQLRTWCDATNARTKRSLPRTPVEMLATERPSMKALPVFVPEVYESHRRRVSVEGFAGLYRNRYSVPDALIGREVEVRETMTRVRIFDGHKLVAEHDKAEPGSGARITGKGHHRRGLQSRTPAPSREEAVLRAVDPAIATLVDTFRTRDGGRAMRSVRRLHRMYLDYPTPELVEAVLRAAEFGLVDLARIEGLVLERLEGRFFRFPGIEGRSAKEETST